MPIFVFVCKDRERARKKRSIHFFSAQNRRKNQTKQTDKESQANEVKEKYKIQKKYYETFVRMHNLEI